MTNAENFTYQVGGSLPADAPSYVERQCDREYYNLLKESKYCYVFNCRQMGKSSLRVRVTHKLQAEGIVCATIDPQKIGVEVTCEQWYASAIRSLVGDLNLKSKFDLRSWIKEREMLSPVQRFAEFIEVVLREVDTPIVIFVEEIDRLLSLKFGMDDFFGLVRSLFEDRPTKPEYNRLTFSFLGVATPTDLIQSHNTSAFNIGYAVEMSGFTFDEALPLMQGLARKVTNPRDYLAAAVSWTGGQPFLIQRLLGIIEKELDGVIPSENIADWVEWLVQERIVTNWESQDAPPHLTTIRDRVISVEEKLRGRMLGCYQQVLADGELEDDRSEERSKLRLTGLVVRRDGKLRSYNSIYARVFNNLWVERQLADLRPEFYGSAFRAWREAELEQNQDFLLRGQALEEAEIWARGKKLSDVDEQFLRESREFERFETSQQLAATEEANAILVAAERKASDRVKVGSVVLGMMLLLAAVAGVWATRSVNEANVKVTNTQKDAQAKLKDADLKVDFANKEANRIGKNAEQEKLSAAQTAMEALAKKKEADEKVEVAKQSLEAAKAELENISQESSEKIMASQAKIVDVEMKVKEALDKQEQADQNVKLATDRIKLAEVKIQSIDGRSLAKSNQMFEALLQSIRAGQKLKQIDRSIWIENNTQMQVVLALQQSVYGVKERNRFLHDSVVRKATFSPNGKIIATASEDGTVKLWSLEGNELQTFKHSNFVSSVVFSPNGQTLATSSGDNTVKLWSLDGKVLQTFNGHSDGVTSVVFSPNGQILATSSGDNTVKLWSLDGKVLQTFKGHSNFVSSVVFSPDGQTIATRGGDNNTVKLWSLDGKVLQTFKGYSSGVVVFSPNGQTLATTSSDNTFKLWSLDGKVLQTFNGHSDGVTSVSFSPNGKTIISGSADETIKLWSLDGQEIQTFKFPSPTRNNFVTSVSFSPNGKTIVSAGNDKVVTLWSVEGREPQTFFGAIMAFSPDSKTFATGFNEVDGLTKLWNLEGREIYSFKKTRHGLKGFYTLSFSPDSKTFAIDGENNTLKLLSLDGMELQTFKGHTNSIRSAAFSPDGKTIATSSDDNTVKLWDLNGKELYTFKGHSTPVVNVIFNSDGKIIASQGDGNTIKLWNLNGKEINTFTFKGISSLDRGIAFSPDGRTIATGDDGVVKLWSLDGKKLQTFNGGHSNLISSLSFSPDGKTIASGSLDKTVKLWSLDGKELQTLQDPRSRYGIYDFFEIRKVIFSPDGKKIASVSGFGNIILWNLDFDDLMTKGCAWLHDYLVNNPNASDEDRAMCGIEARKN